MDVKVIKLTTGEEFFATIFGETDEDYTFDKPMVLGPHPQTGEPMLLPWPMTSQAESLTIKKEYVMFIADLIKQLSQAYSQVTTGLVTAPANALDSKGKLVI